MAWLVLVGWLVAQPPPTIWGPVTLDAYGPGEHADAAGAPFHYETDDGQPVVLEPVDPDAYGPGFGADVYGNPVKPAW